MSTAQLQQLLSRFAERPSALEAPDIGQIRKGFDEMLTQFPPAPGVRFEQTHLNGVPATWCIPPDFLETRVLLYLHGGGYMVGSSTGYRPLASQLATRLKARVLVPDYRLAPENPYPAALEDAVRVYSWLLDNGVAPASLTLAGDSCGGGLTVATMAAVRDAGLPLPTGAALISAWADLDLASDSITSKADEDPLLDQADLRGMANAYLGSTPARIPGASPVYGNLAGLPPMLIQVGSAEILLDDSVRLAALAGAAGVKVQLDIWPKMFHVWHTYAPVLDEGAEALDGIAAFLAALYARTEERRLFTA